MKKLNISKAKTLQKLIESQTINSSEFKDKRFLSQLIEENILRVQQLSSSKSKIHLRDIKSLNIYLKNKFNIDDLEKYISVLQNDTASRSELLDVSGDTKTKEIQTQTGLYVTGYENVILNFENQKFNIVNILEGSSLFIHHTTKFTITKDILVVGVENVENLLQIKKQKYLFKDIKKEKLFMLINPPMLKFLEKLPNEYLHFGDIDLAGISIYETKTKPRVKTGSFFIPKNIEELLKTGNKQLYLKQYDKYNSLSSENKEVQNLIDMINKYQKVIEQEMFIDV